MAVDEDKMAGGVAGGESDGGGGGDSDVEERLAELSTKGAKVPSRPRYSGPIYVTQTCDGQGAARCSWKSWTDIYLSYICYPQHEIHLPPDVAGCMLFPAGLAGCMPACGTVRHGD